MKALLLTIITFASFSVFAQSSGTTDKLEYAITVDQASDFKSCSKLICSVAKKHGDGPCLKLKEINVVVTNLSHHGVDLLLNNSSCLLTIEENGPVTGNPRLGRNN